MIEKLYIYNSCFSDPYKNLATEKILFDSCEKNSLILYLWQNKNTVVIGKNQNPVSECNLSQMKKEGICLARRLSGGGAVYHDMGNLNFTFICHKENYDLSLNMKIISEACHMAGTPAEVSGRNDILAEGKKFSGNAFYNSGDKTYHHGTILVNSDFTALGKYLTPSKLKLQAKGVKSVRSRVVNLCEFNPSLTTEKMAEYITKAAKEILELLPINLPPIEKHLIQELEKEYSSQEFLYGSTAPYNLEYKDKFSWGEVQIYVYVEKGHIKKGKIYTDAMDSSIAEKFEKTIAEAAFNSNSVRNALEKAFPCDIAEDITKLIFEKIE